MNEKNCASCKHRGILYVSEPCKTCLETVKGGGDLCEKWEPRDDAKDADSSACKAMRAMIKNCRHFRTLCADSGCRRCSDWSNKSCAGRKYLEDHRQPDAWETQS